MPDKIEIILGRFVDRDPVILKKKGYEYYLSDLIIAYDSGDDIIISLYWLLKAISHERPDIVERTSSGFIVHV